MTDADTKLAAVRTPEGFAREVLALRDRAAASLAAAQAAGNKKMATIFAREVKKLDKVIEQRGLKRFVQGG